MVLATFDEISLLWIELDNPSVVAPYHIVCDDLRLMVERIAHDRLWSVQNKVATYLEIRDEYLKRLYFDQSTRNSLFGVKMLISTIGQTIHVSDIQAIRRNFTPTTTTPTTTTTSPQPQPRAPPTNQ